MNDSQEKREISYFIDETSDLALFDNRCGCSDAFATEPLHTNDNIFPE